MTPAGSYTDVADKITNFEDYIKRSDSVNTDKKTDIETVKETDKEAAGTTVKNGDTGLIESIEIVDPYNFFTEEEREEYFRERQKAEQQEPEGNAVQEPDEIPVKEEKATDKSAGREANSDIGEVFVEDNDEEYDEEYDDDDYDDAEEDYDEDGEPYDEEDEESEGKDLMLVVVRFASILTGIVILAAIVFGAYRFLAPRFRQDPDEEPIQEVQVALPEGFEETGDMVTVTAVSLNLRTVPNSESDATIVTSVARGTTLKRIAQSSETTWAIVEYEGQQLYASSKYLEAVSQ